MKRHWLRGMLLGVSMALLLTGGVALAQLTFTVEPDCVECDMSVTRTTTGWEPNEELSLRFTSPGSWGTDVSPGHHADGTGRLQGQTAWRCDPDVEQAGTQVISPDVGALGWDPSNYGEWTLRWTGAVTPGSVETTVLFLEDVSQCALWGFVPEPGSILLLGSGLAGLAGYATLRWRTRE